MSGSPISSLAGSPSSNDLRGLRKACQQFEAVFAKKLLAEMRRGVQETQVGDQAGSEIYKDMMDQAIADSIAQRGSLGIGNLLFKQFAKQVEASSDAGASTNAQNQAQRVTKPQDKP